MKNIQWALVAAALVLSAPDARPATFISDTIISVGDNSYDGQDITVSGCVLTINGPHSFASVQLVDNAVLTHTAAPDGDASNLLELTIGNSMQISAGSRVDVSSRGYAGTTGKGGGPGGGTGAIADSNGGGGGGAYGGNGGNPQSSFAGGSAYGSVKQPLDFGSAGGAGYAGNGGAGGGVVRLIVNGTLHIDGSIVANGSPGRAHVYGASGGGAGGSVWITAGSLTGSGSITANGGNGFVVGEEDSGGGAGGRIAVYANLSAFTGSITAVGGNGFVAGGAGSVFTRISGETNGSLLIDNGGLSGAYFPWIETNAFDAMVISNEARVLLTGGQHLIVNSRLDVATNGALFCEGTYRTEAVDDKWIGAGPAITAGEIHVAEGGVVSASGLGYTGTASKGSGPGGGTGTRADSEGGGGGGGYGGKGGDPESSFRGGDAYSTSAEPVDLGSAGGAGYAGIGSAGGGAIRLVVARVLVVDGSLEANGVTGAAHHYGASGGGSGGSLWITASSIEGKGSITAIGGNGHVVAEQDSGGGGGGRIAIYTDSNLFAGLLSARGGTGYIAGGAGTIFTRTSAQTAGTVVLDNGGLGSGIHPWLETTPLDECLVTNSALVQLVGRQTLLVNGRLTVARNSSVVCDAANRSDRIDDQWAGVGPSVSAGAIWIDPGGSITASGLGYTGTGGSGNGPGGGTGIRVDITGGGGGGAYGGNGGNPQSPYFGGTAYGSLTMPVDLGSAGGAGYAGIGGSGGGAVRLIVSGELRVDGNVEANGVNGFAHVYGASGGGAGGSIWITAGTVSGGGAITANGGQGFIVSEEDSGGGGGGRIAMYTDTNNFSGALTVLGGSGYIAGGSGTIFTKSSSQSSGSLYLSAVITNNAATPWHASVPLDEVRLLAGSRLSLSGASKWSAKQLTLDSGATLVLGGDAVLGAMECALAEGSIVRFESTYNTAQVDSQWIGRGPTLCANALVLAPGALMTADGLGYTAAGTTGGGPGGGTGTRADSDGAGGGGAYGGNGGNPTSRFLGGNAYGSAKTPLDLGSAGGAGYAGLGGAGGGAIHIIVTNEFQLDGVVSANGLPGLGHNYGSSGGGAGGSIWLVAGALSGTGAVSAVGGSAPVVSEQDGGGGSGGRIALWCGTTNFIGSLTASGGVAQVPGAAGTVFTKLSAQPDGTLWIDNGGLNGADTPWPVAGVFGQIIVTNAARLRTASPGVFESGTVTVDENGSLWLGGDAIHDFDHLIVTTNGIVISESLITAPTPVRDWSAVGPVLAARMITVDDGGRITSDGRGYSGTNARGDGPGGGSGTRADTNGGGGGGGHGGAGGNGQVNQPGGGTYGYEIEPTDAGSAGGAGFAGPGGAGGGVLRLIAHEVVTIDGSVSASGNAGASHNYGASGGGAGGSIWISTPLLRGTGSVLANGGAGIAVSEEDGGGGGGGRIAIYATANEFAGAIAADQGGGPRPGGVGTVYLTDVFPAPHVLTQSPTNQVLRPVDTVEVRLDQALNPATVSKADVSVTTPAGGIAQSELEVAVLGGVLLRIQFPPQSAAGQYQVAVGPQIENRFGQSMSAAYTGSFTIARPMLSGTVRDTNGAPVAGVVVRASAVNAATTDAEGKYAMSMAPGWTGTLTPSGADWLFEPANRSYANLGAHTVNQDFVATAIPRPLLIASVRDGKLRVEWQSTTGSVYQVESSSTLEGWIDFGTAVTGDGNVLFVEAEIAEKQFFRIRVGQ